MTLAELQAAYPGCPNAVLTQEIPGKEIIWGVKRLLGHSVQRVVDDTKEVMVSALEECGDDPRADQERLTITRLAMVEMDHPDFRKYVAAKLGMM